jgi:hypothetical protein
MLVACAAALIVAVPAWAAAPEAPVTSSPAKAITATSALLEGTLNPSASAKAGWYFAYSPGGGCLGGETSSHEEEVVGKSLHEQAEVFGLQPDKTYAFCLVATNEGGETTAGNAVAFTTKAAAPSVYYAYDYDVDSTEATLQAAVNANNQATKAHLQYGTSSAVNGEGGLVTATSVASTELAAEYGERAVGPAVVTGLAPGTTYYYQAVATNATGMTYGEAESFTTPPMPVTEAATDVAATSAKLTGHFKLLPNEETSWGFKYNAGPECLGQDSKSSPENDASAGTGSALAEESVTLSNLQPNTEYAACLEVTTQSGRQLSNEVFFTTQVAPPSIGSESASEVTLSSAKLSAQINAYGLPTTYSFEYVPQSVYKLSGFTAATRLPSSPAALEASHADVTATVPVSGLESETEYEYRVVTTNSAGVSDGGTQSLKTLLESSQAPDGRVDELVTPDENDSADVYAPEIPGIAFLQTDAEADLPFQVSENGDAVTYAGDPTFGGSGAAGGPNRANQFLAVRGSHGWVAQNVTPHGRPQALYEAFSANLHTAIMHAGGEYLEPDSILPGVVNGQRVLYARDDESGEFTPLYTLFFGPEPEGGGLLAHFAGGTEDFSSILFEVGGAVQEGDPPGRGLYEQTGTATTRINILPDGENEPEASFGAPGRERGSTHFTLEGNADPDYGGDISENGSRVFWTGLHSHGLYLYQAGHPTLQLDESKAGGPGGGGQFWAASKDGARVLFTDDASAELTSNTVPGSGVNLYEYNVESHTLNDLTPAAEAEVRGVAAATPSGNVVYFVADGALAPGAQSQHCATEGGKCNLYAWDEGTTTFVAALSWADEKYEDPSTAESGDWAQATAERTAEVSSSGETLIFDSQAMLTDYNNESLTEVYVYNLASRDLDCASCDPSGSAPQRSPVYPASTIAGVLPVAVVNREDPAEFDYQDQNFAFTPRWMSADGDEVFFDSLVPLVREDTNGHIDVYEWERHGTHGCAESGGCVHLLSSATSNDNSYLLGLSESGSDVFFITRAQLSPEDKNEYYDVYDAREDGTEPVSAPSCEGTGCQGAAPSAPSFATPPSETFAGGGNFEPLPSTPVKAKKITSVSPRVRALDKALKACRKLGKRRRARCEALARHRYAAKAKQKLPPAGKPGAKKTPATRKGR